MSKKAKRAKSSKKPKKKTIKPSPSAKSIVSLSDIKIKPGDTRSLPFLHKHRTILACLFLLVATFVVYYPVQNYDFVNYDDTDYVYKNRHVQDGLTWDSLPWALTTTHAGNWHPVTWVSHMLDCQFFGLKPGWHHLGNLIFHITNALLIFLILLSMTGDFWESSFVAGLFALHPLHVESVAWVAERKDVLSTLFFLLTIWSYIRWVKRPKTTWYLLVLFLLALGLMTKPMVVTLPFVLILIDYWPLKRLEIDPSDATRIQIWQSSQKLFLEKVPMFVLVALSSAATFYAQEHGGAVLSLDNLPLADRVGNAAVSYVNYIIKMIYPSQLAVLYPYPETLPWWQVTGALLLLVLTTFLAFKVVRKVPYFTVGWLWYVGTLVPVIGLLQVGSQSMADRYTYIPLIGIFIIIAWGIPELMSSLPGKKKWLVTAAAIVLSVLMALTQKQIQYWKNSITLFTHTLEVTSNNPISHNNLGNALFKKGQTDDAIEHYLEALRIKPDYVDAHNNLAAAFFRKGNVELAIRHFKKAIQINPNYVDARNNLKKVMILQKKNQ
jgi:protein O-mannosyl-transferase